MKASFIFVAAIILIGVVAQMGDCYEHSGTMVQGMFGYECVNKK